MWRYKLIGLFLFLKSLTGKIDFEASRLEITQNKKFYSIEKEGYIELPEISGLTYVNKNLYAITDSGGESYVYVLDSDITIADTIALRQIKNIDWEALTSDDQGNLYVADTGNNSNRRKNLSIYKIKDQSIDTIAISYALQKKFPPVTSEKNFDNESIFWHNGELHLFSKNRGKKCVSHYILPGKKGSYNLQPVEQLKLNAMITGAAISPDKQLAVLSGYGKLYFFKVTDRTIFSNPIMLIESTRFGQNEAITFIDDNTLLLCNEAGKFYKITFTLPQEKKIY